jgi:hypothetical protein
MPGGGAFASAVRRESGEKALFSALEAFFS